MKNHCSSIVIVALLTIAFISGNTFGKTELSQEDARKALEKLNIPDDKISFFNAITNNDTVIVDLFLLSGMSPDTLITVKDSAITPLILASYNNNIEMVKLLINKKADINYMCVIKQNEERTALYYAMQKLNYEICKLLIEKGAHTYFIHDGKIYKGKEMLEKMIAKKEYVSIDGKPLPMDAQARGKAVKILELLKKYSDNDLITLTGKVSMTPKGWTFEQGDQPQKTEGYKLGEKLPDMLKEILEQAKNQNAPVTIIGEPDRKGYIYINKIRFNDKQYSVPNYRGGK
jgi:hypothetical protein